MADNDAAKPLLDLKNEISELSRKFLGDDKPAAIKVVYAGDKPDTSYHDSMVKSANESFKEADDKKRAAEKAAKRKPLPRKR